MVMGYMPVVVEVVDEKLIKEICPEEFNGFVLILEKVNLTIDDFALIARYDPHDLIGEVSCSIDEDIIVADFKGSTAEELAENIIKKYDKLIKTFEEKTKLSLLLKEHNSGNEGDRYDEIDGYYWEVGGVYQYTPAGEKYKDYIETKGFVDFG